MNTAESRSDALKAAVLDLFDLDDHEQVLLEEACRTLDVCDELAGIVEADGMVVAGNGGVPKMHPAVVELRHQRTTLARLLVALRIPTSDDGEDVVAGPRSQRRGIRGVHVA